MRSGRAAIESGGAPNVDRDLDSASLNLEGRRGAQIELQLLAQVRVRDCARPCAERSERQRIAYHRDNADDHRTSLELYRDVLAVQTRELQFYLIALLVEVFWRD